MDNRTVKFEGQNGTMIVGPDGIIIERDTQQAYKERSRRKIELKYRDLAEVKHRRASLRPGYLQFNLRPGAEGATPLSRVTKIGYSRENTHKFRRARDIIKANMMRYANEDEVRDEENLNKSDGTTSAEHTTNEEHTSVSIKGLPFRR